MATRGFELSLLELDLIGEVLGLDVRQFPFQFPSHGEYVTERKRLAAAAERTLDEKGLINGPRFAPEVEQLLGVYARGRLSIALLGNAGDQELYARVSTDGQFAVLVEQHDQIVSFQPIGPDALIRPLVSLIPPMKPGPGRAVTISKSAAQPVRPVRRDDLDDMFSAGVLQAVRPDDSNSVDLGYVQEIMRRPRLGGCAFAVTARGTSRRHDKTMSMSTVDTDAGRYALIPAERPDGTVDISCTPADLPRIDQALSRYVQALR